jgi:hypothetical protein
MQIYLDTVIVFLFQLEVLCILGGYKSVCTQFPHLTISASEMCQSKLIPWMPTLVRTPQLFLGRHEQAEERTVVEGLGITHMLSIGRWGKNNILVYLSQKIFFFHRGPGILRYDTRAWYTLGSTASATSSTPSTRHSK